MLLSAVIPGGGQLYCENYWKAAIFIGAEGALGYYAYQYHKENQENKRNNLLWWLASVKLLSIADAYVTANMYKFNDQMKLSFDIEPKQDFFSVGLQTKLKVLDK